MLGGVVAGNLKLENRALGKFQKVLSAFGSGFGALKEKLPQLFKGVELLPTKGLIGFLFTPEGFTLSMAAIAAATGGGQVLRRALEMLGEYKLKKRKQSTLAAALKAWEELSENLATVLTSPIILTSKAFSFTASVWKDIFGTAEQSIFEQNPVRAFFTALTLLPPELFDNFADFLHTLGNKLKTGLRFMLKQFGRSFLLAASPVLGLLAKLFTKIKGLGSVLVPTRFLFRRRKTWLEELAEGIREWGTVVLGEKAAEGLASFLYTAGSYFGLKSAKKEKATKLKEGLIDFAQNVALAVSSPVLLVLKGAVAFKTGIKKLFKGLAISMEKVRLFLERTGTFLKESTLSIIKGVFGIAKGILKKLFELPQKVIGGFWKIARVLGKLGTFLKDLFSKSSSALSWAGRILSWAGEFIGGVISTLLAPEGLLAAAVVGVAIAANTVFKKQMEKAGEWLGDKFYNFAQGVKKFFGQVKQRIGSWWLSVKRGVAHLFGETYLKLRLSEHAHLVLKIPEKALETANHLKVGRFKVQLITSSPLCKTISGRCTWLMARDEFTGYLFVLPVSYKSLKTAVKQLKGRSTLFPDDVKFIASVKQIAKSGQKLLVAPYLLRNKEEVKGIEETLSTVLTSASTAAKKAKSKRSIVFESDEVTVVTGGLGLLY